MDFRLRRQKMVDRLAAAGIQDPAVLRAFLEVPRHLFVEEALREKAYGTHSLPIGFQQTISQPEIAARMTELLQIRPEDRVLEVGTGSGYQAAVLARLAAEVLTVERIPQLARRAEKVLLSLQLGNVRVKICDGSLGLGEGEFFGETDLASDKPSDITVRTITPCVLLTLSRKDLDTILSEQPNLAVGDKVRVDAEGITRRS